MKEIQVNPELVAYCGIYCGACKSYLKDKCKGCHENIKATWCKLRLCCIENKYSSCADCEQYNDPADCKLFNNIVSKFFALVFRSDRAASIRRIRETGVPAYADEMTAKRQMTLKK